MWKVDVTGQREGPSRLPQSIEERLKIGPKTKLLVYGYGDAVIMKKIEILDVTKDLERLYARVDKKVAKYGPLSDKDINNIVLETRRKKRENR